MPRTATNEGIRAADGLASTHPDIGVVVLSQHIEPDYALRLFNGGSQGRAYLLKERVGDLAQLRHAIVTAAQGGSVLDPQVVDVLVTARRQRATSVLDRLTARELEMLQLVARGASNHAIPEALVLSDLAVERHITNILGKLDLAADDTEVHRRVRAALLYLAESSGSAGTAPSTRVPRPGEESTVRVPPSPPMRSSRMSSHGPARRAQDRSQRDRPRFRSEGPHPTCTAPP